MPPLSLEQRVQELERKVAQIQTEHNDRPGRNDWQQTVGMFTDKPGVLEIFEEAMKLREADRAKARRGVHRTKRAKS